MFKQQLHAILDMDGVMADFELDFCMTYGAANRHMANLGNRYPDKRKEIEHFVARASTYAYLTPIPLGIQIAKWCMQRMRDKQPRCYTEIVTSRPLLSTPITEEWLKHNGVPFNKLTVNPHKVRYIQQVKPDIIVDDIIDVCQQVYNSIPDVTAILVAQPWNDTIFFPRITTLEQFQTLYERVASEKLLTDFRGARMASDILGP